MYKLTQIEREFLRNILKLHIEEDAELIKFIGPNNKSVTDFIKHNIDLSTSILKKIKGGCKL